MQMNETDIDIEPDEFDEEDEIEEPVPNQLMVNLQDLIDFSQGERRGNVEFTLQPSLQAGLTTRHYQRLADPDITELCKQLRTQVDAAVDNSRYGEAMLASQAYTLDALFNNLARRAANADRMDTLETYLKLALRAQSQCRSTWEAVSAIQNPPLGYVKQANIAHGPQQVNNGHRTGDIENPQSKLLETQHGERLDFGETGTSSGADPELETVGAIDGAKDG